MINDDEERKKEGEKENKVFRRKQVYS